MHSWLWPFLRCLHKAYMFYTGRGPTGGARPGSRTHKPHRARTVGKSERRKLVPSWQPDLLGPAITSCAVAQWVLDALDLGSADPYQISTIDEESQLREVRMRSSVRQRFGRESRNRDMSSGARGLRMNYIRPDPRYL